MSSKAKFKKNMARLIALVLAAIMCLGFFAYFTQGEPVKYFDYSEGLTEEGYFEGVTALDYVILPEYKTFTMPKEHTIATEDEIDAEVAFIRSSYATVEKDLDADRAIVNGDTVNIDFVGSIDGVEFEGGSTDGAGTDLAIGSKTFIDDFEEQLIGHKPGENFDIEVTFPENYGNEELNGKDAVFNITINHNYKTITPEITDDFIKENMADYYTDVADLRAKLAEDIVDASTKNYVWGKIINGTTVTEYPEAVHNYEVAARKASFEMAAAQYGVTVDSYLQVFGGVESFDAYLEKYDADIKAAEKVYLTVQAICEKDGYTVEEADVENYFKTVFNTDDYDAYVESYGMPYLKSIIVRDKILNTLISEMEVVETVEDTTVTE